MNADNPPAAQRDRSRSRNRAPPGARDGGGEAPLPPRPPRPVAAASHASSLPLAEPTVEAARLTPARDDTRTPGAPGPSTAATDQHQHQHQTEHIQTPRRSSRTADRSARPPKRSPSLPSRLASELSPRAQLHADMIFMAEVEVRGAISKPLMQVISMYLMDKCREIEGVTRSPELAHQVSASQHINLPPSTPTRRPRTPDVGSESDAAPKRPCVQQAQPLAHYDSCRDPRLRSRTDQRGAPPMAPPTPAPVPMRTAPVATTRQQPSFADALRAAGPSTAAPAAASSANTSAPTTAQTDATTVKKPRFPPLIAEVFPNWARHFQALRTKLGQAPNARPYGAGVRFFPTSIEEYRIVQRYLTELEEADGVLWYAYALPSEKSKKVAIRGLPASTAPEDIILALGELGFQAEYVRPIRARMGRPGCIFFAILAPAENLLPAIYHVTELMNMPGVIIEAWRGKRGPAQCHRCQAFRHSSHGCHRRLACVRCGGEHTARDCPRPLEEPATCVNCGGPHPANHTACPQYKREARNRRAGTLAISKEPRTRDRDRPSQPTQPFAPNTVAAEGHATNLMAPANPAIERGRRRRKRGGVKRRQKPPPPPTAAAMTDRPLTSVTTTVPNSALDTYQARNRRQIPVERAIGTLQEILIALREGRDPTQLVLNATEAYLK